MAPQSDSSNSAGSQEWARRDAQESRDAGRKSMREGRAEGDVRRSVNNSRPSLSKRDGDDRRRNSGGGYVQHDEDLPSARGGRNLQGSGSFRGSQDRGDLRRSTSVDVESSTSASDAETEVFVNDETGWAKMSDVYPDGLPDDLLGEKRRSVQPEDDDSEVRPMRRSSSGGQNLSKSKVITARNSYKHASTGEGQGRQSVNSVRQARDDEGDDTRRSSRGGQKSFDQDFGMEPEVRRSVTRSSYGAASNGEGEGRRSMSNGRSNGRNSSSRACDDEGDGDRRISNGGRKSFDQGPGLDSDGERELQRKSYSRTTNDDVELRRPSNTDGQAEVRRSSRNDSKLSCNRGAEDGHSRRGSGDSNGAQQRMLSRPRLDEASDAETEVYLEHSGWVKRSEAAKLKLRSEKFEVMLDPDNKREMASIIWDFSKSGARVKSLGSACPESARNALRTGDELFSINGKEVLGKPKSFIQQEWSEASMYDEEFKLIFVPRG
eukprot:TRINITY_DN82326_c0_g1_i1.p1 TRINITY_DN82326_c0_g1~~TRINITY_DN82326_c0_g1_i1.p1  ORF type:complete len:491 (-),score=93.86 TRINITY_DN82326_c0_g1_i1:32-1504(-)